MKKLLPIFLVIVTACNTTAQQPELPALIPVPAILKANSGSFQLTEKTKIVIPPDSPELKKFNNDLLSN